MSIPSVDALQLRLFLAPGRINSIVNFALRIPHISEGKTGKASVKDRPNRLGRCLL